MVGLATIATVIASQAMITGVFSLTQQAVQLGYLPRMQIVHTSSKTRGQIYLPRINWALMGACIGLVLAFGSSSRLAGAYGIAVTATMAISSLLYLFVVTMRWGWSWWKALLLVSLFLGFDGAFFGANLLKLLDGGWITLLLAGGITVIMATWRDGRKAIADRMLAQRLPFELFLRDVNRHHPHRVSGTAVFLTVSQQGVPAALLHFFKHTHVLYERVLLLSIAVVDVPFLGSHERVTLLDIGAGFFRVVARYGFMEKPDVPEIMLIVEGLGLSSPLVRTTYFLGRETLLTTGSSPMARWRKTIFALMSRNAQTAMSYYNIPVNRVVELGQQISL
jgi:KUP system potassium uptake protein